MHEVDITIAQDEEDPEELETPSAEVDATVEEVAVAEVVAEITIIKQETIIERNTKNSHPKKRREDLPLSSPSLNYLHRTIEITQIKISRREGEDPMVASGKETEAISTAQEAIPTKEIKIMKVKKAKEQQIMLSNQPATAEVAEVEQPVVEEPEEEEVEDSEEIEIEAVEDTQAEGVVMVVGLTMTTNTDKRKIQVLPENIKMI
jgi:hypothetical protein